MAGAFFSVNRKPGESRERFRSTPPGLSLWRRSPTLMVGQGFWTTGQSVQTVAKPLSTCRIWARQLTGKNVLDPTQLNFLSWKLSATRCTVGLHEAGVCLESVEDGVRLGKRAMKYYRVLNNEFKSLKRCACVCEPCFSSC